MINEIDLVDINNIDIIAEISKKYPNYHKYIAN